METFTNRNVTAWLQLMRELELNEDFDEVFSADDKTEYELSHPRYIEDFLEDDE